MLAKFENTTIFLCSIVLILWLYWLWGRRHFYMFSLKVPTSWGVPFLGIMSQLSSVDDMLPKIGKMFEECKSNNLCAWFGVQPIYITTDLDTIEQVLTSPDLLSKADLLYKPINDNLGPGLITNPAKKWQHNRKLLSPSFQHKVLLSFFPVFQKAKNMVVTNFNSLDKSFAHGIFETLQTIALGVSAETTMGIPLEEIDRSHNRVAVKSLVSIVEKAMMHIIFKSVGLGFLYNLNPQYRKIRNTLNDFVNQLLATKLRKGPSEDQSNNNAKTNFESMKKTPRIFIDNAIKIFQQHQISYNDIIGESNHVVLAAFETSSKALFSTILMLAMHHNVQDRLFEEIVQVFPEKDFEMQYEHLEQLPYLSMVVNEVLRLAPPIPVMGRQVSKDITQFDNNLSLPKNMQILISTFHLHRRKDIWGPNADKFNPDNFLPENLADKHPYAYIPFSKGARNCIGWRYALFFVKVLTAGLVRNFKFFTDFQYENLQYSINIVLKYTKEPKIMLHPR